MVSSVVVVLLLLGAESVFGQSSGSRALVCVDDLRARVPGSAVMDAANLVERLYREAEVSFRWSHSVSGMKVSSSCGDAAPRLDMLIVRYRPPSVDPGTLAATASAPRRAPMTLVYYDAIEGYARKQHLPVPTVLGYVMAHEIGHVLLGEAHAESGIMRSSWTEDELRRMPSEHLRFPDGQRMLLHAKVVSLQTAGRASLILAESVRTTN